MNQTLRVPFLIAGALSAILAARGAAEPARKLLVIGVDGLRPDAMETANTPVIRGLIADGCFSNDAQGEDLTFSGPNWATILHGIHRDKHKVTSNGYGRHRLGDYPDFLALLERHEARLVTARLTTWDQIHLKQPTGADIDIFHDHQRGGDERITAEAEALIAGRHPDHPGDVDAMFVFFCDVDTAGHSHGFHPSRAGYLAAIEQTDARIGRVMSAIRSRPAYAREDWLIILTSDHGGSKDGGHRGNTPEERRIPFIVSGPSAARGSLFPQPKAVDVAKTALAFMGAPIPGNLDGRIVGLARYADGAREARLGVNLIFNGDAEYDRGFAESGPDQYISGWFDPGPDQVSTLVYGATDFPGPDSPGPADRGRSFFSGGTTPDSAMTQSIDLAALGPALDTGAAEFRLTGWLGGNGRQEDGARLVARFKSAGGALLGEAVIGPVGAAERENITGLVYRGSSGQVPRGTRSAEVVLVCRRGGGAVNDAYADNLSLVLTAPAVASERAGDGAAGAGTGAGTVQVP